MTNEEAIEILKEDSCVDCACANMSYAKCEYEGNCDIRTAMNMAIEALKAQPCKDAISRQAVLDAITANCIWENEYNLTSSRIKKAVEALPPVTPKPRPGKWVKDKNLYKCTVCNDLCVQAGWASYILEEQMYRAFKYCPNCGVKMERE